MDGRQVGVVLQGDSIDTFTPDLSGYTPMGRADADMEPIGRVDPGIHGHRPKRHDAPLGSYTPQGQKHQSPTSSGTPFEQGSAETDRAIREASRAHGLDVNTMRAIASIESSMNPSSNANRSTQYKGLYQIGREEWSRFGEGNIYSAQDNAMATARMFGVHKQQFKRIYGRDPTDAELYMIHQQGLGFYTRGAMTNIGGNPYPGMRGAQTHESFESGWGREVARRKEKFERIYGTNEARVAPANPEEAAP